VITETPLIFGIGIPRSDAAPASGAAANARNSRRARCLSVCKINLQRYPF
jgi:hypothetical protein